MAMAVRWRERPVDPVGMEGRLLLADGSVLRIRRFVEPDAPKLRRFYLGLSAQSLYRRFMTPVPRLPEGILAYLCETDRLDREVVVVTCRDEIVAEGRYHQIGRASCRERV